MVGLMAACGLNSDRRPWFRVVLLILVVAAFWLGTRQRAAPMEHEASPREASLATTRPFTSLSSPLERREERVDFPLVPCGRAAPVAEKGVREPLFSLL